MTYRKNSVLRNIAVLALLLAANQLWATISMQGQNATCSGGVIGFRAEPSPYQPAYMYWYVTHPGTTRQYLGATYAGDTMYVSFPTPGVSEVTVETSCCGSNSMPVYVDTFDTPNSISGPTFVCAGQEVTYCANGTPGAWDYVWQAPSGWLINGSSAFQVTTRSNCVRMTPTASAVPGQVQVRARGVAACAASAWRGLSVGVSTATPATPLIGGEPTLCYGSYGTFYPYNSISNPVQTEWRVTYVPTGATYTATTNSLNLDGSTNAGSYNLYVRVSDGCRWSDWGTQNVQVRYCTSGGGSGGVKPGPCTYCLVAPAPARSYERNDILGHDPAALYEVLEEGGNYYAYVEQSDEGSAQLSFDGDRQGEVYVFVHDGQMISETRSYAVDPGQVLDLDLPQGVRQYFVVSLQPFALLLEDVADDNRADTASQDDLHDDSHIGTVLRELDVIAPSKDYSLQPLVRPDGKLITIAVDEQNRRNYPLMGMRYRPNRNQQPQ